MVYVFNKEALSWYLLACKLNETVGGKLPKSLPSTPAATPTTAAPAPLEISPPATRDVVIVSPSEPQITPRESEWVISIREKLRRARAEEDDCLWEKVSIYRVPESLKEGEHRAYAPEMVAIGPFHRGRRRLRPMEQHKWRALDHVVRRTGRDVTAYVDAVGPLEERIRAAYEGGVGMASQELVLAMVLDGTFMLELFRGAQHGGRGFADLGYSPQDPVFAMRSILHAVRQDMILLENQIPLFVLDKLLGVQQGRPDQTGGAGGLAVRFFDPLMPTDAPLLQRGNSTVNVAMAAFDPLSGPGLHCLDVFRRSLLTAAAVQPKPPPPNRLWPSRWASSHRRVADRRQQQFVHSVSELREGGIRCRRSNTDRFWDIRFVNGVLHIPRLLIHDGTKYLFLNLIAFEQCHLNTATPSGSNITSYAIFMDNLINTAEDVRYLHDQGIIEHCLGSDGEVADLFNRICQEVVFDVNDSYLAGLSAQVNRYYGFKWSNWIAALKHNYFGNPWTTVSLVAAVFLLLLTTAQTFYSVYSYYLPPH